MFVSPVGNGWRAVIFPPGSSSALPESPATLEKSPKEAIVAEAKKLSTHGSMHKIDELSARCSCADEVIE